MLSRRAFATVEFALVAPLLFFLVAGAVDYGVFLRGAIAAADAARAGAEYGSLSVSNASNLSAIQTAALNAAPDLTGLTATAVKTCQCSNGTVVNCSGGTCSTGGVRIYVQVTAKVTLAPLFSFPQVPYTGAITSVATMRAQ